MPWMPATFKGKAVWVETDASGEPSVEMGRVAMRYAKSEGAKLYRANVGNLNIDASASPIELPPGTRDEPTDKAAPAPARGKGRASGFGKAGTRTASQAQAAREDAREKLATLAEGTHRCFTDGGCKGNPGPAGSGVRVELADGRVCEVSRSLGRGTNNIAELTAIAIALDVLDEQGIEADAPVAIFSDSDYARGVLTRGWKAKKNTELILALRERLAARPGVQIVWVAGHAGIAGNERADALAGAGVAGVSAVRWA